MREKYLVVGSGIAGSCIARKLADDGYSVDVYEKEKFVSGSCLDEISGRYYKQFFGAHIFRTDDEEIWQFLNRFGKFNTYQHKVLGLIDGILAPIPFNFNSIELLFPKKKAEKLIDLLTKKYGFNSKVTISELIKSKDSEISELGNYVYEKVYKHYTQKQWGTEVVDKSILDAIPIRLNKDDRYFENKYQGIPVDGFKNLIENMLKHPLIKVYKNKKFDLSCSNKYKKIFYSGCIDELMGYSFGKLPYRSLTFDFDIYNKNYDMSSAVVNYPNNYDFTRVLYFNKLLPEREFSKSCICKEIPTAYKEGENMPFYPIKSKENDILYNKYKRLLNKKIIPIGRLGLYRYMDINTTLKTSLEIYDKNKGDL